MSDSDLQLFCIVHFVNSGAYSCIWKVREAIDELGFDFQSLGVERTSLLSEYNPEVQVIAPQGVTSLLSLALLGEGKTPGY